MDIPSFFKIPTMLLSLKGLREGSALINCLILLLIAVDDHSPPSVFWQQQQLKIREGKKMWR